MGFNLLDIFAKAGVDYLHPGGKKSTAYLIQKIQPVDGMKVLEIGCGTGATLAQLSQHTGVHLFGVDVSAEMLKTAEQRMEYCGISSVSLKLIQPGGKLPFEDNFFDAVYAESVLGIIEPPALSVLLAEIKRVLKPAGTFFSVDAVWQSNTPVEKIREINHRCKKDFGIIQSNESPSDENEWNAFFGQTGFVHIESLEIRQMKTDNEHVQSRSDTFTTYKKRTAFLNPALVAAYISSLVWIKCFHRNDGKHLKNYFFQMEKSK
jgi:ubiquinone/menaquinone biosynthesis C-methylase UbiE